MTVNQLKLDIVDDVTLASVMNLNGADDGATTGFAVLNLSWGVLTPRNDFIDQSPYPGAALALSQDQLVDVQASFLVKGTSAENLRDQVALLATYIRKGMTLRYKPDTASTYRYVRTFPGSRAPLLRGDDLDALNVLDEYVSIEFPVAFKRWPYFFRPSVALFTDTAVSYTAPTVQATVSSDMPSPAKLRVQLDDAGAEMVDVLWGLKSGVQSDLNEFAAMCYQALPGTTRNNSQWVKDWGVTITPSSGKALAGTYLVVARIAFQNQSLDTGGYVQLKYAQTTSGPAGLSAEAVFLDTSDLDNADLNNDCEIPLGHVTFDEHAPGLTIEGWSKHVPITWKSLVLVPVDELSGRYTSPGAVGLRQFSPLVWLGSDLDLVGSASLNADYEVKLGHSTDKTKTGTFNLPTGIHVATFVGHIENPNGNKQRIGSFKLYKNTVLQRSARINTEGRRRLTYNHRYPPAAISWKVTNAADNWELKVEYDLDETTTGYPRIFVDRLVVGFVPTISDGNSIVVDGMTRQEWIGTATQRYWPVSQRGPYLELQKGRNLLLIRAGKFYDSGYDKVSTKGPLLRANTSWAPKVSLDVMPMDSN